jgi:hypothetical protein
MLIDEIVNKSYQKAEEEKVAFRRWLEYVESIKKDDEITDVLKNSAFLRRTFYMRKTGTISRAHYYKVKEYLANLLAFYFISVPLPTHDEVLDSQEFICFFKGLRDVINLIDEVGSSKWNGYSAQWDLLFIKSIVILGWHGFTPLEIAHIKKRSVFSADKNGVAQYLIQMEKGETVEILEWEYIILKNLSHSVAHKGLPAGKQRVYKGDDTQLFRPLIHTQDTISERDIIQALKRFNKEIPDGNYTAINFRNLRKNALFVDVFRDKTSGGVINKIMEHFGCNMTVAYGFEKQYKQWKDVFMASIAEISDVSENRLK